MTTILNTYQREANSYKSTVLDYRHRQLGNCALGDLIAQLRIFIHAYVKFDHAMYIHVMQTVVDCLQHKLILPPHSEPR